VVLDPEKHQFKMSHVLLYMIL